MRITRANTNGGSILVALLKFLIFVIFFVILFKFAQMYSIKMMNSFFNKEETKVPNLVSRDGSPVRIEDAFELCKQQRLQIDIKDKKYDNNIPEGCIIAQDPPPDSIVKVNRVIEVMTSLGAKTIDCPDVTGKDVRDVTFLIQNKGFLLGKKSYIYSETIQADTIIAQTPDGNSKAPKGAQIDLLISLGKANQNVQVPNFIGKKMQAAKIVLNKINLEIGKIGYESREGAEPGTVLKQEPSPGTLVPDKSQISFIAVEGPEQVESSVVEKDNRVIINSDAPIIDASKENLIKLNAGKAASTEGVQTLKKEPAPQSAVTADTKPVEQGQEEKHVEIIKFIVPPGQKSREVKMVQLDSLGPREIYKAFHYPGEEIDLSITGYGEIKVLISLDNVFFKDIEVGRGK